MSQYGYNVLEKALMVLITGITNFWGIPGMLIDNEEKRIYGAFSNIFTIVTSFMYHTLDSLGVHSFLFDQGHWHRLDNIGSVSCLVMLNIRMMKNQNDYLDELLNFSILILTLILQQGYPWSLTSTIIPIIISLCLLFGQYIYVGVPQYHSEALKRGGINMMIAIVCFIIGSDQVNDYLRIFHGLWHLFVFVGAYYLSCSSIYDPESKIIYYQDLVPYLKQLQYKVL